MSRIALQRWMLQMIPWQTQLQIPILARARKKEIPMSFHADVALILSRACARARLYCSHVFILRADK